MSPSVLPDLNLPAFQDDLFALEPAEAGMVFEALRNVRALPWTAVQADAGLKWESINGAPCRLTIRLSRASRAVVVREGDFMRFIALHPDHDQVYGRK